MNNNQQVSRIEHGWEQGVKEEPWKQQLSQLDVVAEHPNFYLTHQNVVSADFLLFNQTQLPQLFKVMECDAWAAEMEGTLDFADTDWGSSF